MRMNYKKRRLVGLIMALLTVVFYIGFIPNSKTDVSADDFVTITVTTDGDVDSKADMIARINEIRKEAYELGYIEKYTEVKWSSDLEEIAIQRAAESSIFFEHTRPDGSSCFTAESSNGVSGYGEIIASSSTGLSAIEQWYGEKDEYAKYKAGEDHGVIGHYAILIGCEYIGIGSFGVTAGEAGGGLDAYSHDQIQKSGYREAQIKLSSENFSKLKLSISVKSNADSTYLNEGENCTATAKISGESGWGSLGIKGATFSSDNGGVITMNSDGTGKAVSCGTCNISASALDGKLTGSSSQSVCGWRQNDTGWWYSLGNGDYIEWGSIKVDGTYYRFRNGYLVTSDNSSSTSSGVSAGWKKNSTGWWYQNADGSYPHGEWKKISGSWYYFDASGYMAAGEYVDGYWINYDGSWSYPYTGSWKHNSTGWWYEDTAGWYPVNQWLKINGLWYYFKGDGYMASNMYVDGYWLGADGAWR